MSIHSVSMKGKRPQNEDKDSIFINLEGTDQSKGNINCYFLFDGHGGKFVSKFLNDHLPQCFTDKRVIYPLKKSFIMQIYNYWQNILENEYSKNATNTGSTCLIVAHYKKDANEYINILNTGDSRCIICKNNIGVSLTKDHKPNYPEEKARIKSLGGEPIFDGFDWRIMDLSVSRAFGDLSANPFVTHIPDIFRYKITDEDKFIILACDGLWDVLSNQDVVNFVLDNCYDIISNTRINKHINIAKRLAEFAIVKGSTDNVTVIVIFLQE